MEAAPLPAAAPAAPEAAGPRRWLERAKRFYHDHEPSCTAAFFVAGFLFDTAFVGRIDHLHNILHQASYLTLCALFTSLELRETHGRFSPPARFQTAWRYHTGATHFMLGTLLNIYTLFYFKSASAGASFVFLSLLATMLGVNELKPFESSGTAMRMGLFSLCLISYFTYLIPTLAGVLGPWVFAGSMACATAVIGALVWWLQRDLSERPQVVWRAVLGPYLAVLVGFTALYFARLIPPVPLSLQTIGVYHEVKRDGDDFALTMTRSRWRFWEKGDQTFFARPGDRVHCFVSVFSPTRFHEKLQVRWQLWDDKLGWQQADAIPLAITGGRDGGFRGETVKARYKPGRWRVLVETSDERELGRISVTVVDDPSTEPRAERVVYR